MSMTKKDQNYMVFHNVSNETIANTMKYTIYTCAVLHNIHVF